MRRLVLSLGAASLLAAALSACGDDSSSGTGSSKCGAICNCVANAGGEQARADCNTQCAQTYTEADCRSKLEANNFSQCEGLCTGFGASQQSGGGGATLADFCNKCAQCVVDSTFDEGFCTPFKSGTGFDTAACSAGADRTQLANPSFTPGQVAAWSCQEFDSNE